MADTSSYPNDAAHFETALRDIRATAPLIHNIANLVVTNVTANALLALGASPAMVENTEEAAELAAIAGALVINLGTMSSAWAAAMRLAALSAYQAGTPWVLDPVAVGALGYRTRLAAELVESHPAVIRGNASEIMALAGQASGGGKGVDSLASSDAAIQAAQELAQRYGNVVTVSGAVDYVTDGTRLVGIGNGHPIMSRVTGMGCTASALTGAYLAVLEDPFDAAVQAMAVMGVAGDIVMERDKAIGPGSFQVSFLDTLYHLDAAGIAARVKLS